MWPWSSRLDKSKSQPGITALTDHGRTCPPPMTMTLTETYYVNQELATVVEDDPNSVSSYFSSVGAIDSAVIVHSSQDRPTGQPADTAPIYFTRTASGPAVIASDDPNDSTVLYRIVGSTSVAVSATVESFPPAGPVVPPTALPNKSVPDNQPSLTDADGDGTVTATVITYASTVTVAVTASVTPPSNLSVVPKLHKRQTCSMIFAKINGDWASWCNNWDGTSVVSHSTYNATVLVTSPVGLASPIPESVYNPVLSLSVSAVSSVSYEPTFTSTPTTFPSPADEPTSTTVPATLPGVHTSGSKPSSTSTPHTLPGVQSSNGTSTTSEDQGLSVTSKVFTTSITMTIPITTITTVLPDNNAASSTASPCGQVGQFSIGFDDLPTYSTKNPNDTASPPIFDPYDHFYWSSGYGYGPPPSTPYMPHDGSRLAMYDPMDAVEAPTEKTEGRYLPGSFGAGPRAANDIFWFDARSAFIGCNNTVSSTPCQITATGYHWVPNASFNGSVTEAGREVLSYAQDYTVPAVCAEQPCPLIEITFDPTKFSGLSTLNLKAKLDDTEIGFYLDGFEAVWTNSSCAAGLTRASSRK